MINKQLDFYHIDESFIDTDAVYVVVPGPKCAGRQYAERLFRCLYLIREVLNEEAQEK